MNINFNKLITKILPFLYIFLFAYFLSITLYVYLPKYGVSKIKSTLDLPKYRHYNIDYAINQQSFLNKPIKSIPKVVDNYSILSNIILRAIFSTTNNEGYIIIEEKNNHKTHILEYNDIFNGYKLIQINKKNSIFERNNTNYKLIFKKSKSQKNYSKNNNTIQDGTIRISKQKIKTYTKNINKIWKDIQINEYKIDGQSIGFKINKIKTKSIFDKIGLKNGDIIKEINGTILTNNAAAFKVYQQFKNSKYINMTIQRNKLQMELSYELY